MEKNFSITDKKNGKYSVKNLTTMSSTNIYFHQCPTENCQVDSLGRTGYLSNRFTVKELKDIFGYLFDNHFITGILLMDIKKQRYEKIRQAFTKADIVLEQPYISSNGNHMVILMVKRKSVLARYQNRMKKEQKENRLKL